MRKPWIKIFILGLLSGPLASHSAIAYTDQKKHSENQLSRAWLSCSVTSQIPNSSASWADSICTTAAEALSAIRVSDGKFREKLVSTEDTTLCKERWLARLTVNIVDRHLLRFSFSHGSAEEWRESKQTSHDNFDLNVLDSEIDLRVVEHLIRTLKALAS